ncbi:MAG: hypothetical protein ACLGIR_07055 [Actinomycetes bacterium]
MTGHDATRTHDEGTTLRTISDLLAAIDLLEGPERDHAVARLETILEFSGELRELALGVLALDLAPLVAGRRRRRRLQAA